MEQYKEGMVVLKFLESNKPMGIDSSRIAYLIRQKLILFIPIENNANTWEGIKVLGSQSLIGNDLLVSRINIYASYDALTERFNQLPKKSRMGLRELTSRCQNTKELEFYYKNGFNNSESIDKETMRCTFLIDKLPNLIGTIIISAIVNREYSLETKKMGIELTQYLEDNYPYLR